MYPFDENVAQKLFQIKESYSTGESKARNMWKIFQAFKIVIACNEIIHGLVGITHLFNNQIVANKQIKWFWVFLKWLLLKSVW